MPGEAVGALCPVKENQNQTEVKAVKIDFIHKSCYNRGRESLM